jgi:hypothetical protein
MSAPPRVYQDFRHAWTAHRAELVDAFGRGRHSFVPDLLPEQALELPGADVLEILRTRYGATVEAALEAASAPANARPVRQPVIPSPVAGEPDGRWLAQTDIVGVNVRTVGTFWNVVKYTLTVPAVHSAIHLLPIWEPGVVDSLYGPSSWELNREFFSPELADLVPRLDTVERQLCAVVNLLHAAGRVVGMDVLPHVDRFSETVLALPRFFEWLQREGTTIVRHGPTLHDAVEALIVRFLAEAGPAIPRSALPDSPAALFGELPETARLELLFGQPDDLAGRFRRRNALIRRLHEYGLEPVPATMAPPYRGLAVDERAAPVIDAEGMEWRDYRVLDPTPMSRVFGPLARYQLYEIKGSLSDSWEFDFERPRADVWRYVCDKYADVQRRYGFDFMRGDMAHVQMRPDGVVAKVDAHYDLLGAVKEHIRAANQAPYFASLAESFLAPRDVISYGEEMDHLEAAGADVVLGDLQSTAVGTPIFIQRLRQYDDYAEVRRCSPCLTVMTGDKDDPRFDELYLRGNEVRLFVALFLSGMPSYTGLGFETRDAHPSPAPNEHYTKLFVYRAASGSTATTGAYVWGRNGHLFAAVTRMRMLLDEIAGELDGRRAEWRLHPDPTGERRVIAWTVDGAAQRLLFMANLDTERASPSFGVPLPLHGPPDGRWELHFSTLSEEADNSVPLSSNGVYLVVPGLAPGEGRLYRGADLIGEAKLPSAAAPIVNGISRA